MNLVVKQVIKNLAPPILFEAARKALRTRNNRGSVIEWEAVGDADSAWTNGSGWSHQSILELQLRRWKSFVDAAAAPRQLGVWPGSEEPDLNLHNLLITFGYVLGRAAAGRSHLSVLDWGGGLGHYYVYARELQPQLTIDYVVKDLPIFCESGRSLLPDVTFVADDSALSRQYDLVFASSSIHYSNKFYDTIARVAQSASRWLMITRLPCVTNNGDFVVVQRPISRGYLTEYPCWFVNRDRFISFVQQQHFVLRREFFQTGAPIVVNAPEQCYHTGFLFERNT